MVKENPDDSYLEPEKNPIWKLLNMAVEIECFYVADDHEKTNANSRRIWNALIAEELADEQIDWIVENSGLSKSDLAPLTKTEFDQVVKVLDIAEDGVPGLLSEFVFSRTYFRDRVDLKGYVFVDAIFNDCVFASGFDLDGCMVLDGLSMTDCRHISKAKVSNTTVVGIANFAGSTYESQAEFFGGYFETFAVERCQFEREASFQGIEVGMDAHFTGAVFNHSTSFKSARFPHQVPRFFGATIHEDTNFADVQWPTTSHTNNDKAEAARDAVRAYECLKRIVGDQRKFRQEHMFLQLEMKSQERTEGLVQSLPSRLFRYSSDYGWSYIRPIVALITAWAAAGLFFAASKCSGTLSGEVNPYSCWLESFALSFANLFAFLGIGRTLLPDELAELDGFGLAETVAGMQMIVGPIFIFFVLLAFRNRFRMK
jgi:hypothetical protein